jgi:hypothetical protein
MEVEMKNKFKGWTDDFHEFMEVSEKRPPAQLSEMIQNKIAHDLNPAWWQIFLKITMVHLIVGALTLLICPQFGIGLLPGLGLTEIFMTFGPQACSLACGALFLGTSLLMASLFLCPEEVKMIRKNRIPQLLSLVALSALIFIGLGVSAFDVLLGAWFLGGFIGSLISLELGWFLRFSIR